MQDRNEGGVTVWKIAGGILLAVAILWGLAMCSGLVLMSAAVDSMNQVSKELSKPPRRSTPASPRPAPQVRVTRPEDVPLAENERCIEHQRIRREGNTFTNVGSC